MNKQTVQIIQGAIDDINFLCGRKFTLEVHRAGLYVLKEESLDAYTSLLNRNEMLIFLEGLRRGVHLGLAKKPQS